MGSAPSPKLALKSALEVPMAEIRVLRSDVGSRTCGARPPMSVLAKEIIFLSNYNGRVDAKLASSPGCRNWRSSIRERMLGSVSPPLLTSTHLTVMAVFPSSSALRQWPS